MEHIIGLLHRKDSNETLDSTFQDVVHDLVQQLKEKGVDVPDSFVLTMVKIVSMEPRNKFLAKQALDSLEMERPKRLVIEQILRMSETTRNVIRIQLHYKANSFTRLEVVEARRQWLEQQIHQVMFELTKSIPKHKRHYDAYYEKLVIAAITWSGMGPYSEFQVMKETEAALQSIFPKDDIKLLNKMTAKGREQEIRHLMKMAAGIRLYNRDLDPKNAGAGITDLPKLLLEKVAANNQILLEMRARNLQRLITYTTITKPYFLDEVTTTNTYGRREFSQDMVFVRNGLTMVHQLLIYLKDIADELSDEDKLTSNMVNDLQDSVADLRTTMQEKDQVATSTIYPKFVELADAWEKIQDSLMYTEFLENLINALHGYSEENLNEIDAAIPELAGEDLQIPNEEEFFTFPEYVMMDDPHSLAQRTVFSSKDVDPSNTQYGGFCLWALVKGYGLVLLSNPNIGVYNWKGHQYLFSCPEGAIEFARNPDAFIHKAIHVIRRWPELINLLKMGHDVFNQQIVQAADRAAAAATLDVKISTDMAVQTELHPIESNIVPGYSWNEWDLRKQALILSNIHKCSTHSTQTHWQALKKTQEVQTFSARNRRIQTDQSKYAEAPRNQFYFWGLRGLHSEPPHIVELTREPVMELRCLPKSRDPNRMTLQDFRENHCKKRGA